MSNAFWNAYKTDTKLEEEGVWIDDFEGGVSVKVRSPNSIEARKVRRKLEEQEPFRLALKKAQRKRGQMDVELEDELNRRWLAEGVVIDWKNLPGPDGQPLPFTADNAAMVFKALPKFFEDVLLACTGNDTFKGEEEKVEDKGNSKKS